MPVKRRNAKRRISTEREYEVWSGLLQTGRDFFGEGPEIGLPDLHQSRVPTDLAREAWQRLGPRYMAENPDSNPWALRQFGPPESLEARIER